MCAFRPTATETCSNPASLNGKEQKSVTGNGAAKSNGSKLATLIPKVSDCRLCKILQMIESGSPHKIHDLALECNLSHSHLQHLFKQHTGLGLGRMLTEQKMHRAADLLGHTSMSIKEIAWAVGYEHTSSFTRAFERHFLQSPRCYRQTQELNRVLNSERAG
jgi:transcriptional regulator GlxA family with amidase domain